MPIFGVAVGRPRDMYRDLTAAVEVTARESGLDPCRITDGSLARTVDVVLAVGFPRDTPWLVEPSGGIRISWLGEPLPRADASRVAGLRRQLPMGRLLDGAIGVTTIGRRRPAAPWLGESRERAAYEHDQRLNLDDHVRAARAGIRLVVTSDDRGATLRRHGIEASVVPFGYHPALAGPPHPVADEDRDIDVLVLASAATGLPTRRVRILAEVIRQLDPRTRVTVVEGGAWGAERERLLRRARIVLNVHRVPGNFTGIRTVLVGAAGALLVSEPVDTPAPFVPGVHYLEAAAGDLASVIRDTLADRPRRHEIAANLQRFLLEELTMARSLQTVLATVT